MIGESISHLFVFVFIKISFQDIRPDYLSMCPLVRWFGGGDRLPGAAEPFSVGPYVVVLASLLQSGECCS